MKAVQAKTRITLKNILFAADFSAASDAAAPIAVQIARRFGAKVYGMHVNDFDVYTAAAPNAWAAIAEAAEKLAHFLLDLSASHPETQGEVLHTSA